jgi:hypothetical protein
VVAIVLLVGVAAAWFFLLRGGGGVRGAVSDYMTAGMTGDLEALKLCVTAADRAEIEKAQELMGSAGGGGVVLPFELGEPSMTGNEARVEVSVTLPAEVVAQLASAGLSRESTGNKPVIAVLENGRWKVDMKRTEEAARNTPMMVDAGLISIPLSGLSLPMTVPRSGAGAGPAPPSPEPAPAGEGD